MFVLCISFPADSLQKEESSRCDQGQNKPGILIKNQNGYIFYLFNFYQYWLLVIIGLVSVWYIYATWNFDYWKKQGVPGEKPRFLIGTFKPIWKYSIQDQDIDAMKKFGHVHGGFMGSFPILYISDPDLLRQTLVKDFHIFPDRRSIGDMEKDKVIGNMLSVMTGEKWKMVRNTLTPTYTSGKLKQMVYLIEECVQNTIESVKDKAGIGEPIELTRVFAVLTLDVIASCAFGMKTDCVKHQESEFVLQAQKAFRGYPKLTYLMLTFPKLMSIFKFFPKSIIPNPFKYFEKIADQTIDMRLKNKDFNRRDFLQIMLEAQIPSDENNKTEENESQQTGTKKTLTREIVIAQTVLFILAGHETTANTLSFLAYELATNQDIQEKLIKEVDDVMADCKGKLTYEAVSSMQFLDMAVSETLRKYPPAVRTDRMCVEDYKLNDITIKKGMILGIPIYAIHHNPEFYPDPQTFDPERFSAENKAKRNSFTYLPFGAGPRNCIAMRFALLEVKLVMALMLCNYRFQTSPETQSMQNQDMDAMKKFGHLHGGFMGSFPILYISDPDLLRQTLVKDFHVFPNRRSFGGMEKVKFLGDMLTVMTGEKWKMVRNTLTPTYTSGKLKLMVYLIEECVQNLLESLKDKAGVGEPIELTKTFAVLTLDVIASCGFGMKSDGIKNQQSEFVIQAQKAAGPNPKIVYLIFTLPILLRFFPKSLLPNPFNYFEKIADQTIDMRLKNKDFIRRDFLQIMLEAEIPSDENNKTEENENQQTGTKKTLTREIVIAQTVLFILAGHETTANTLSFLAYELATNQVIQEKLIKEVDDVMADCKGKLTYEAVSSMQFLDMVVSETLRKYPPAVRTDRVCVEDYNLNGITLKKGIMIGIPIYAIHHNPEFYSNPQTFDPERFSAENKAKRNPFTYLPFGAGPRNCIAMRFALLEVKLVIALMLSNYRFQTCPETQVRKICFRFITLEKVMYLEQLPNFSFPYCSALDRDYCGHSLFNGKGPSFKMESLGNDQDQAFGPDN
uniref:Cytochrome P450 n=1 Tax=Strigamia maritima TaxID=126957 RepID=T1INY8_STRMM